MVALLMGRNIRRPVRIILVRHGESEGNVDPSAYARTPDSRVPLTPKGHEQAENTGKCLAPLVKNTRTLWYVSPYRRTWQTFAGLIHGMYGKDKTCVPRVPMKMGRHDEFNPIIAVYEEPRIAEQQFGNFQNPALVKAAKETRNRFGRFWYRFENGGESGLDVYNRITSFISTLHRDFHHVNKVLYSSDQSNDGPRENNNVPINTQTTSPSSSDTKKHTDTDYTVIIVTHGLTLRLFLMRWMHWTVEEFEESQNPRNGEVVIMERKGLGDDVWYELTPDSAQRLHVPPKRHQIDINSYL